MEEQGDPRPVEQAAAGVPGTVEFQRRGRSPDLELAPAWSVPTSKIGWFVKHAIKQKFGPLPQTAGLEEH